MMIKPDIRWKQRFQNFENALGHLTEAINMHNEHVVFRAGLIQFFEMTFELGWKTVKDYLYEQGFAEIKTPREAIKKAFEIGLIEDGHVWMDALEDRNMTSHTYDESTAVAIEKQIREHYYGMLCVLGSMMKTKL